MATKIQFCVKILTDHQQLTFALSNQNNDAKSKSWKARIKKYNYSLIRKPGKKNVVADALSKLPSEQKNLSSLFATQHSAKENCTEIIPHYQAPIYENKNQLILSKGSNSQCHEEPHRRFYWYHIGL